MNITNINRVNVIAQRYAELKQLVEEFIDQRNDGNRRGAINVHIPPYGDITYEKNTSCHCHPEYEQYTISFKEFGKWLENRNNKK